LQQNKKTYYRPNACLNRYVLRSVLKAETESIFLMSGGREVPETRGRAAEGSRPHGGLSTG